MKTYTQLRNLTAKYCNVNKNDATKMAVIDENINDSIRTICNLHGGKLRFLEATHDMYTVADQQAYQIPNKFRKLIDMYTYSGDGNSEFDGIYTPELIFDPNKWKTVFQARMEYQNKIRFKQQNKAFYSQLKN